MSVSHMNSFIRFLLTENHVPALSSIFDRKGFACRLYALRENCLKEFKMLTTLWL